MKKLFIGLFVGLMILSLTGCHDKALEEATVAVAAYNDAAESYNADIMRIMKHAVKSSRWYPT